MRPCGAEGSSQAFTEPDTLAAGTFSGRGSAWGVEFDYFFRGGNPLSLAARALLEIEPEVCLDDFFLS